jgi:4-diphosphocytidyl-2-C-methyl-D-erythritol kinase
MNAITLTAPAKINLFLSVIGKRDNSYHNLQSLVAFSKDFGDVITITSADEFSFSFDSTAEHLPTNDNNLVICAANMLASIVGRNLNCSIHLSKNIPIGAGLGGGSSDAATTIKGLLQFWQVTEEELPIDKLNEILLNLGADVPSCYHAHTCYFEGIGEIITPLKLFPACYGLIVYPNQHSSTPDIFENFDKSFSTEISLPAKFVTTEHLIEFLQSQDNDLTEPAIKNTPEIENILKTISKQGNCYISRMSGSGSACFGLFRTPQDAATAKDNIKNIHPEWWVQTIEL